MAVRSQEELISAIKGILGENTSDEAIALLDDVSDTFSDKGENWKEKYETNDAQWRKRYMERFTATSPPPDAPEPTLPEPTVEEEPRSYDDLFEE